MRMLFYQLSFAIRNDNRWLSTVFKKVFITFIILIKHVYFQIYLYNSYPDIYNIYAFVLFQYTVYVDFLQYIFFDDKYMYI